MDLLFTAAHTAGLVLYGPPDRPDGLGSGLVWFDETSIVHVNLSDLPEHGICLTCGHHADYHTKFSQSENWSCACAVEGCDCKFIDESDYSDCKDGAYPYADDFEFQFYPSNNTGVDVACDIVREMKPDVDGNIYLYYPECGIRVIHTRNDWKE